MHASVQLNYGYEKTLVLTPGIQAHDQDPGPDSKFPIEDILEEADDILREMREHDPRPNDGSECDPGFISSFYIYPAAQAISFVLTCHSLCRSIQIQIQILFSA
jgi:hypothetical protein